MPWPIVPAPSTLMRLIGRAAGGLLSWSEFLFNVSLDASEPKGDANSGHDVAGAWLVRLTRTALVILHAQRKTPTVFLHLMSESRGVGILTKQKEIPKIWL